MLLDIFSWFHPLEPAVKAAVIVGSVTLVTVCLGFIIKDYLIPISLEKRKARIEKVSVFRNYRLPLKESAWSLKHRIDEIFRTRSHMLWRDAPNNDFYNYKIISTNYRLCSLLGWIHAFRLEESYLQVPSKKLHKAISSHLDAFSKSLADGQGVEMDVTNRLLSLLKLNVSTLPEGVVEKFAVQIDHLVQRATASQKSKCFRTVLKNSKKNSCHLYLS